MSDLNGASKLIGDMNITDEDIDDIYEQLDGSLEKIKQNKTNIILEKIEELTKQKDDMSVQEILNWLENQNSAELQNGLKEMQEFLVNDRDLMDYIQGLFFDKMLE